MENCAIVVAAGRGKRFGGYKQFHNFRNRPLLYYTLLTFERSRLIKTVILVAPKGMISRSLAIVKKYGLSKVKMIVPGGKRRQDSVKNGFQAVHRPSGCVVIHDGARPAVTPALLAKGLRLCREYRAVIFGLPVTDTVKTVRNHRVVSTIDREGLFMIQTPQFFHADVLIRAYSRVNFNKNFTDEAGLVEAAGFPVYLFEGDRNNIKITGRDDLRRLEGDL
jgi:2-C-methyl-D-erythritol 4-phosphate cytidylyltransferase